MTKFLPLLLAGAILYANDAPPWVREAALAKPPTYSPKVAAVVLLNEEQLTVDAEGRRVMRERGVVKVLQRGRKTVQAYRSYNAKSGRIRDFQGWLVSPAGKTTVFGKNKIIDVALSDDALYDEAHARVLDPGGDLEPGTIFAYEVIEEEKTVFTQYQYRFQDSAPVMVSRFILSLPPGWEMRGTLFNRATVEPAISGNTYTWEVRDMPWIEDEDFSPDTHALAPRLGVTYYPKGDTRAGLRPLPDWTAVSTWLSGIVEPSAELTAAIRAKAAELIANAPDEIAKVKAIAAFVQQTTYISIQMNVTRAGGYTPHRADDVLAKNYGDCKDKATLMRALLKAAGIESYMTVIYSGDRQFVRPEWASPQQFNHAIIAVRLSADPKLPTVLDHPKLGRLLIFDPTDSHTPLGDLPVSEQGSHALVLAGDKGELLKMPMLPASANRVESASEAEMDLDGRLATKLVRHYYGQAAARLRGLSRTESQDELKRSFEAAMSHRLGGLTMNEFASADKTDGAGFEVNMRFSVNQFGQIMQGRLLMVRPGSLVPSGDYTMPAKPRQNPVRLPANVRKDSVTIKIPSGFEVDEIPDPVRLESPYGNYRASWKAEKEKLSFEQHIEIKDTEAPASDYGKVREFFEKLSSSQHAPVVLLKK